MSAKKKRLGRGLDALLSGSTNDESDNESKPLSASDQLTTLPIEKLQRGQYQPRSYMDQDSLEELAESIKTQGIILPILVRPLDESANNHYEIIAGERRWRAAQLAQLEEVPVIIRDIPDEATLAVALIENIQRENLNPIEEAIGLKRLMDEFELTHQEVANSVGRSRSAVSNLLRLLALNEQAKDLLFEGKLEMGHARALLALPYEQQNSAAREVYAKQLSVRQTEAWIKNLLDGPKTTKKKKTIDPDIRRLESDLSEKLNATVNIQDNKGKGKLVISYHSLDALDGILAHIK
ncbi:MAG: ParB/RepB/Spo0J family partition protein [Arenicella sp.]